MEEQLQALIGLVYKTVAQTTKILNSKDALFNLTGTNKNNNNQWQSQISAWWIGFIYSVAYQRNGISTIARTE